ncbi:TetR family transcriptional regulator [Streptococcus sanguinis SK1087]|uniref:TetR family transcriptional regulator n=1 Tax=Streptococcus sanguinis SK1087 TaxID=888824 RepID=F3SM94_STRSA|nr:TetR family transcriptional regulator [Streptococcus sanguinis SK1087]
MSHRAVDAVLSVRKKAIYLEETHSEARPSVEAELRDIDAEERSDVSAMSLNERNLLG